MQVKPSSPRPRRARSPGLSAAWPLADHGSPTRDAVGGNPLTLQGGVTWTVGPDGPALSLDGGGSTYLQTTAAVLNPFLTDFSLALWFNPSVSASGQENLVQQLDGTKSIGGTGTGRTWLYLTTGGSGTAVLASFLGGAQTSGVTHVRTSTWHHAVVTVQKSLISLYLDGNPEATNSLAPEDNAAELRFGLSKTGNQGFAGQVGRAGMAIWRRALSAAEVMRLNADPYRLWTPRRRWAEFSPPPFAARLVRRTLYDRAGSRGVS